MKKIERYNKEMEISKINNYTESDFESDRVDWEFMNSLSKDKYHKLYWKLSENEKKDIEYTYMEHNLENLDNTLRILRRYE